MSKQIEALKLALEVIEAWDRGANASDYWRDRFDAITAIREALADSALDRMAENARDLGLDYEPAQQEPVELDPKDVHVEVVTKQMGGFAPVMTNGVRLTHKPTGTVVEETAERSAHRNRDVAWKRLAQLVTSPKPAQPFQSAQQQEPVAWRWTESNGQHWFDWRTDWTHHDRAKAMGFAIEYAYTSPPQRKPLTDEEILDMARTFGAQPWPPGSCVAFARAIEAKLKENT